MQAMFVRVDTLFSSTLAMVAQEGNNNNNNNNDNNNNLASLGLPFFLLSATLQPAG